MIYVSLSRANSPIPSQNRYFTQEAVVGWHGLARLVCNNVWSPIIWKMGKRATENFISCGLMVFDFDDGRMSCEQAVNFLGTNCGFIGATKSHQKEKHGVTCDRFRIVMQFCNTILDYPTYRQNYERLSKRVPCDLACKDGARMYQPCREILHIQAGDKLAVQPYVEPPPRERIDYRALGILPRWLEEKMRHIPSGGGNDSRNKHCFVIAAKLAELGYGDSEIVDRILSLPVDLTEREKRTAAASGIRIGRRM